MFSGDALAESGISKRVLKKWLTGRTTYNILFRNFYNKKCDFYKEYFDSAYTLDQEILLIPEESRKKRLMHLIRKTSSSPTDKNQWKSENKVTIVNEDVMMADLLYLYSMVEAMMLVNENLDISTFPKLKPFPKKQSVGYQAKILTREEVSRFLTEAPVEEHLLMKINRLKVYRKLRIVAIVLKMPPSSFRSYIKTLPVKVPFFAECMLFLAMQVYYLDHHVKRVEKKYFKFNIEKEMKYFTMLSILRTDLKTYSDIYKCVQERKMEDAIRLFLTKVLNREELVQYYADCARTTRQDYRATRRKPIKYLSEGYEEVVKIMVNVGKYVEEGFSYVIHNNEIDLQILR